SSFNECVRLARQAKKETHDLLRPKGVKVYFDGALGSEGALLSRPYLSGSGAGLQLLEVSQLAEMMQICFQNNLEIAVHAIGDEAAHIVARVALDLKSQNILGQLHLEHAELLRPETIKIFSQLGVICHLQPCHWLSDKKWLNNKIGELARFAFRWQELESAGVKYYFGSDSPIEKTSMQNNLYAVWDAKQNNIALPREDFFRDVSLMTRAHSHPDFNWCLETYSQFELGELVKIMFRGHQIG
ncbi:MAG: amidohydrolase family protein, partial [Bdellovibrionales bacterium]|nr:amidohydrolase family protein [Bdellovibrionales bacterium]